MTVKRVDHECYQVGDFDIVLHYGEWCIIRGFATIKDGFRTWFSALWWLLNWQPS